VSTQPLLLNTREAARLLSLSPSTLRDMRRSGDGPAFVTFTRGKAGRVRYRVDVLQEWVGCLKPHQSTKDKEIEQ